MKLIWISVITGYAVLAVAIGANGLATAVGVQTWYGLFAEPAVGIADAVFLFGLYPVALGLAAIGGVRGGEWSWNAVMHSGEKGR